MKITLVELRRIIGEEARRHGKVWTGKGPSPQQKAFGVGRKPVDPATALYNKARRAGKPKKDAAVEHDLREAEDAFGPSEQDLVMRLLNEAITLIERASQLASRGALEKPYAQELERIDKELRSFVLDMGGGDDT